MNRHDRRKQRALGGTLPSGRDKLRARDAFVGYVSGDPDHRAKLSALETELLERLGDFTWVDAMCVFLRLAATMSVVGPTLANSGGVLTGFDERTFTENARRTYLQIQGGGSRSKSPEAS